MFISKLKRFYIISFVTIILLGSCTKREERIIPGNIAPPDNTIPNSLKINFINKLYISLLGREPETAEYEAAKTSLDTSNFSKSSRSSLIETVLENPVFYEREYELMRSDLLNSTDTLQINDMIGAFLFLLASPAYEAQWPIIQIELDKLLLLKNVPLNLKNGNISIREMQQIGCNNFFFDNINMGSANFVIATFQHLLLRNPTAFESQEGIKLVDGFSGTLFLNTGNSKTDYFNIFFNSSDYCEGQVKLLFTRFLFRLPNSEEAVFYTNLYKQQFDYKNLVKEILSLDEYAKSN
jgi:hypothetical protein